MVTSELSAFANLIAPLSLDHFFENYWLKQYAVIDGELERLPAWLQSPLLNDFHHLAGEYRGRISIQSGRASGKQVPLSQVHAADLYEMGLSIYFHDIANYVDGADDFVKQLALELGLEPRRVKAAAFASPPGDGLAFHYDTYEIFSIQLQGTKKFHVAPVKEVTFPCGEPYSVDIPPKDELYPQMANGFPQHAPADYKTIEMKPGSVLFMPRGTWHSTEAGEDSLSVSIALVAPPSVDILMEQLRLLLLQDKRWRKPLYGINNESSLSDVAKNQISELINDLEQKPKSLRTRFVLKYGVDDMSRFQRNPMCTLHTEEIARDRVQVKLHAYKRGVAQPYADISNFEISVRMLPLLEWIESSREPFTLKQLEKTFSEYQVKELRDILYLLTEGELIRLLYFPALETVDSNRDVSWKTKISYSFNNV